MKLSRRGTGLALLAGGLAALTPFATPVVWGVGAVLAALLMLALVPAPARKRAPRKSGGAVRGRTAVKAKKGSSSFLEKRSKKLLSVSGKANAQSR